MIAFKTATFLLMLAGVSAIREGNIILLPSARLEVAEACSGIRSLFSLLALAIVCGYLLETKIGIRVLLALMAIPISVLANALRIAITGIVVENWGVERAEGTIPMFSGWLVFIASLALIFLLHRLLQGLWLGPGEPAVREECA
jgi:exosortase